MTANTTTTATTIRSIFLLPDFFGACAAGCWPGAGGGVWSATGAGWVGGAAAGAG
jgi:hypothetical protein